MSVSVPGGRLRLSTGVDEDTITVSIGPSTEAAGAAGQAPPASPWSASSACARAMGGRIEVAGKGLRLRLPRSFSGSMGGTGAQGIPGYADCRGITGCRGSDSCPGNGAGDRPCWLGDLVTPGRGADCSSCHVMETDLEAISRVSTRIMLVSSDESMLHRVPRYLGRMAGYLVVPVGSGESARRGVQLIDPHVVIVDDYLRDADAFSLAQQLRETAGTGGYRVIICSEADEPWVDLRKPLDDATLVTVVNKSLLSTGGWTRRGPGKRPVVLFWASRSEMAGMFSELLLDFGVLPVLSDGCFDLIAQARSVDPNLVIVQSRYGSPDAQSALGIMGDDAALSSIPVLLIGGRDDWLRSRFSRRLAAEASGTQIEDAIRELLSYSGVLRPPLLVVRDLGIRLLLEAGFRDRYGFRPVTRLDPRVDDLALSDTVICGPCITPDAEKREQWAEHRVIYLAAPSGTAGLGGNETVLPWSRFSLDRLWNLLEEEGE
jgi:CheY-like chemotaxis protein